MGSIPTPATSFLCLSSSQLTPLGASDLSATPDSFVRVASVEEVPDGTFVEVEIGDEILLLAHVESGFHAVSAWCTHQGTSLALGTLTGPVVQCWAHLWRFDVRTGEPVWPPMSRIAPGYRLRVHEVRVEADTVYVKRPPPADVSTWTRRRAAGLTRAGGGGIVGRRGGEGRDRFAP